MKHSKAPFLLEKSKYDVHIRAADGYSIAAITIEDLEDREYSRPDEDLANAHLFGASPELLAGLRQAVERCPCSVKERLSGHLVDCLAPEWIETIVKAEGVIHGG